ncbi:methyltransferase domain-containing protein [Mesorhizobium sp. WSM2239]|uniref:Methyltransferase domain-containing protein n=2 Tax=unclassified Mesorhizobium TaxID=325217 RepID=A0AAU8DB93_9HYPH
MPGLADRLVEPEILDGLAEKDPRAIAARRDLVRVNGLMFQQAIMTRLLGRHVASPPRRILEIGAGDGAFMLGVARRLAKRWPAVELTLLDRADLVTPERRVAFAELGWQATAITADVFDWLHSAGDVRFDVVAANLFLHHFADADLARLFSALRLLAPVFVAAEPRRTGLAHAASRLLWAVGAGDVTRHDAPTSVRAGFRHSELSTLWPAESDHLEERGAGLFTHVFAANRAERSIDDL